MRQNKGLVWKISVLLGVLVFSLLGTPIQSAEAAKKNKVKITHRLEAWTTTYVTGNFGRKYGLEIDAIPFMTGIETMEALLSKSVDFANIGNTPATSLLARSKGIQIIALAARQDGRMYRLIVHRKSGIRNFAGLKGKRIATKIGSGSYAALIKYSKSQGMSINDFNILNSNPGEILAAMEAGAVDAGLWLEPLPSIMISKGLGRALVTFKGVVNTAAVWMAHKSFIEANPDLTVRFLASVLDSGDILTNYKDVATQLISRGFARRGRKIKLSLFRRSLDRTFEPNLSDGYILPILSGSWKGLKARRRVKGSEPDWSKKINEKYLLRAIELRRKTSPDISSKR